jgi:hypothetical protein
LKQKSYQKNWKRLSLDETRHYWGVIRTTL